MAPSDIKPLIHLRFLPFLSPDQATKKSDKSGTGYN